MISTDNKNSLWSAVQYGTAMIVSFVTLKLNLITFGADLFGIWILLFSIWGFGSILDFGLSTSLVKFLAEDFHKTGKLNNALVTTSLLFLSVLGFLIVLIAILTGTLLYIWDSTLVMPSMKTEAMTILILLGVGFYFKYISIAFQATLEGMNNFITTSKISILYHLLMLASSAIVYIQDSTLLFLAILYAISGLVYFGIYFLRMHTLFSDFSVKPSFIQINLIRSIFSYSMSVQFSTMVGAMFDPLIKYVLGSFHGSGIVSYYEIARRFATAASQLFYFSFRILLPKASILETDVEFKTFLDQNAAKNSSFGVVYSNAVFGIGSIVIALIIQYYFGFPEAFLLFLILAIPESINNFGFSLFIFLLGVKRAMFLALLQLSGLIIMLSILVSGFVIFDSAIGLLGFAVAILFTNTVMLIYVRGMSGISLKAYLKRSGALKLVVLVSTLLFCVYVVSGKLLSPIQTSFLLAGFTLVLNIRDFAHYTRRIIVALFPGKQV